MADLFAGNAADWDTRPLPQQISEGVFGALASSLRLGPELCVMDFGAGTGLVSAKIAPHVGQILAVDISEAMLEQLAAKPELHGKVKLYCQNILDEPLVQTVDLVVSAMAMHHVEDTSALLAALFAHLKPGGRVALADLDSEEGDFHPPGMEGVYHAGFDRELLGKAMQEAGLDAVQFTTACVVNKDGKDYPIFLVTAAKSA